MELQNHERAQHNRHRKRGLIVCVHQWRSLASQTQITIAAPVTGENSLDLHVPPGGLSVNWSRTPTSDSYSGIRCRRRPNMGERRFVAPRPRPPHRPRHLDHRPGGGGSGAGKPHAGTDWQCLRRWPLGAPTSITEHPGPWWRVRQSARDRPRPPAPVGGSPRSAAQHFEPRGNWTAGLHSLLV